MLIAIDPGLRWCGVARFYEGGELQQAELVRSPGTDRGPMAWRRMADHVRSAIITQTYKAVVEVPRIYPHSAQQKGDLNDLLELAGVVGALAGVFDVLEFVYPATWKGQVPKKVMNARVLATLSLAERSALIHNDHNTLDAVGIGLFYLGRLGARKVFR